MVTREELFSAVRLIKEHCKLYTEQECLLNCPLLRTCNRCFVETPQEWPDPEGRRRQGMKKRIYLMRRNFRIAWLLLCLPLHLCIMAAWNGFRLKGNTDVPWEGGWENWLN